MTEVKAGTLFLTDLLHPMERQTMVSLQDTVIGSAVAQLIGSIRSQTVAASQLNLTGYPVTAQTCPRLYRIYRKVLRRLSCKEEYKLYLDFGYQIAAKSFGSGKDGHIILVNSACLQELNDDELAALLGHEVGHILGDHIQYREVLDTFEDVAAFPFAGEIIKKKVCSFFARWMVVSEYTADRAALVASGSLEAVLSLLRKQAGVRDDRVSWQDIIRQPMLPMPAQLGVFYMVAVQNMSNFGMTARMKEIIAWNNSPQFRKDQPYLYYCGKAYVDDPPENENEAELLRLHRRASQGNAIAATMLGEAYMRKGQSASLPAALSTAVSLLTRASYAGEGRAMYLLSAPFRLGIESYDREQRITILKKNEALAEQLLRASADKMPGVRELLSRYPKRSRSVLLPNFCIAFIRANPTAGCCEVNRLSPGEPLTQEDSAYIRNAFWIEADARVYMAEAAMEGADWFGLAVADTGLYGRLPGESYPFYLSWKDFAADEIAGSSLDGQAKLFCGKKLLFQRPGTLEKSRGTMIEAVVKLKSATKL